MYDNPLLTLGKVIDDMNAIKQYNNQIVTLLKKDFVTKKLDLYGYEHYLNVLQCMVLRIEEVNHELNDYINRNARKGLKIDVTA